MKKKRHSEDIMYGLMVLFLFLVLIAAGIYRWKGPHLVQALGIAGQETENCLFRQRFHLYCPGCGGTRAVLSLLEGQICKVLYYHPAVWYSALIYLLFFVTHTLERLTKGKIRGMRFRPIYLFVMAALIFGTVIVRNILLLAFHMPTI